MDGSAKPSTVATKPAGTVLSLHIIAGAHAGAVIPLGQTDMMVIGRSDDCDLILSDAGVARHHCIVTRQGRRVSLRAIEAPVTLRGREHGPGETLKLTQSMSFQMGEATLAVSADAPQALPDAVASEETAATREAAGFLQRHRWGVAAGLGAAVALGLGTAALELRAQPADAAARPEEIVSSVVTRLGLDEVTTAHNAAGQVELRGVVPDAGSETRLREGLAQHHIAAAVAVRSGAAVAHDVTEVLRLSGIAADAQYGGDGMVTVRGHLGDQQALAAVVQSRAMHEIEGLKRVVAYNQDHPGQTVSSTAPENKRIVSVVANADPYVVTADGSHYYVGAQLPQGGKLSGVESDSLLVEHEGKIDRLRLPGLHFGS